MKIDCSLVRGERCGSLSINRSWCLQINARLSVAWVITDFNLRKLIDTTFLFFILEHQGPETRGNALQFLLAHQSMLKRGFANNVTLFNLFPNSQLGGSFFFHHFEVDTNLKQPHYVSHITVRMSNFGKELMRQRLSLLLFPWQFG